MILRAKAEGLPLPVAIAPGTPWSDLTGTGDITQSLKEPGGSVCQCNGTIP